jgi:hypothetical protein
MGGLTYPAAAQVTSPPDCNNTPAYNYTIGNPLTTTDYDAGGGLYTFATGTYHVVGNIRFVNGKFEIKPGTKFYADGTNYTSKKTIVISGYSLTIGKEAFLQADGALFTAACNNANPAAPKASTWKGIRFESSQPGQKLHLGGDCVVAYAECGVYVPPTVNGNTNNTQYEIWDTRFDQNLRHVVDYGHHDGRVAPCYISHITCYSQPSLLAPYQASPHDTWTIEGLHLTPTGPVDGRAEIIIDATDRVRGGSSINTITGAVYGLVANQPGQGEIKIDHALNITRILRIGIWLDELKPIIAWGGNTSVDLHSFAAVYGRTYQSMFTAPGERNYGVVAAVVNSNAGGYHIQVAGVGGNDTTNRVQTGVFINQVDYPVQNMTLSNLTFGMNLREGSQSVKGNAFSSCWHGVYVRPNIGSYTVGFSIGCNTFAASGAGTSSALLIDPSGRLNQQGSIGNPMGNKFTGYANGQNSIMNRNTNPVYPLDYYRYQNSVDEQATVITTGFNLNPTGQVYDTSNPSYPLNANFCLLSQAASGGAQARGAVATTYLRALMDTVRRRAAPTARLDTYQAAIRQTLLVTQPDTAALEAYVGTLATNPEAFFGLGLDLLEQYRRKGRATAVARLRPVLAARIAARPAAANRLAMFDVVGRVAKMTPGPRQQVLAADSLTLRRLARTPGGEAETAAIWFNYLFPGAGLSPVAPRNGLTGAAPTPALSQIVVRALYPNPASDRLHVELSAPASAQAVVLRLTELLSGRVALQAEVPGTKAGNRVADVDVHALPAGQYVAVVLVDGMPSVTQKLLINR